MFSSLNERPVKLQDAARKKQPEIWTIPHSAACIYPVHDSDISCTFVEGTSEDKTMAHSALPVADT
ncbi:hypothetical protein RPPX_21115 [Pseudomonas putida S12]|uniref:Uncharacterized protein n=1 Tax=Pseudomonas putida S12 TaxID=1215087 RepID=A0AA34RYQ1_PSEPU|nr:hypothetical protein RPPX_21115 [Pseudomonas putida S12]RIZ40423.1 hypothetical protein CIK02_12365 [Pseudomonas putida]